MQTVHVASGASAGIYPSLEARAAVMSIYDEKLARWPVPFEELDVRTRYGFTHVVASGAADAPPVVLVHMAGCAAIVWRSLVASLATDHRVYAIDTIGDAGKSALDDLHRHPRSGADYVHDVGGRRRVEKDVGHRQLHDARGARLFHL
jgi:pimeloyl-ACP methyl ester carboxylesterase